jgi:vancomycin aglycone glucosyltransferase
MRVWLSVCGSRGDVQPLLGLAVALRDLGAEVQMCAPPDDDYAELFARVGVPVVPVGAPIRSMAPPTSAAGLPRRAAEFVATQSDPVAEAAAGCDVLLASGLAHFASRSVADKLACACLT